MVPSPTSLRPLLLCLALVACLSSPRRGVDAHEHVTQQLRGLQQPQEQEPEAQMSSAVAEYRKQDGEYEVVVRRVPIQRSSDGLDNVVDPWMQMALAKGIDLNDYNVTYEDGTWETLEEDHRRNLIAINSWENNNARYCVYERNIRGISGLSWSVDLIQQAQMQAAYMASLGHIEHRANLAEGIDPGWRIICENVCQNTDIGFGGAFTALMNDEGHRDNILNVRVSYVGVGVSRSGNYYYMAQVLKGTS